MPLKHNVTTLHCPKTKHIIPGIVPYVLLKLLLSVDFFKLNVFKAQVLQSDTKRYTISRDMFP